MQQRVESNSPCTEKECFTFCKAYALTLGIMIRVYGLHINSRVDMVVSGIKNDITSSGIYADATCCVKIAHLFDCNRLKHDDEDNDIICHLFRLAPRQVPVAIDTLCRTI